MGAGKSLSFVSLHMNRRALLIASCGLMLPPGAAILGQPRVSTLDSEVYTALVNKGTEELKPGELISVVVAAQTISPKGYRAS